MTPKEKAIKLVDKYLGNIIFNINQNLEVSVIETAKKCATIAVDEIIKAKQEDSSFCDEYGEFHDFNYFWQSVIEEIEKL
jgi:hypothetical protein